MYVMAASLVLLTISRLPLKLPHSKGPGRRHRGGDGGGSSGSGAGAAITFADVAGVDEAKEELQEIVVGAGAWVQSCGCRVVRV